MVKAEVNGLWSYKPFPFQQSCTTAQSWRSAQPWLRVHSRTPNAEGQRQGSGSVTVPSTKD